MIGSKDYLFLCDLDKTLAIIGSIFALVLIAYLSRTEGRVVYLLTGILVLISCLLWLKIRENYTCECHLPESLTWTHLWGICFFGLYTLSVLSVYLRSELYERPLPYFIQTAFMAGTLALEILTSGRKHSCFILTQILLLGVNIAWFQIMIFPNLLGVDPWYHCALSEQIINEGSIPDGNSYSKMPLFHLMIAETSLISNLSYKFADMVSVSLGQILCDALFLFLIARYLFKNNQVSLLASLMVVIANYHIRMSFWSIPNAFAAVFIPIILYLILTKVMNPTHKYKNLHINGIIITVMVVVILTHTITAMCMAILLFVAWGALLFYRTFYSRVENYISLLIPCGFTTMMFAWWMYTSEGVIQMLGELIRTNFDADVFIKTPTQFINYATSVPLGEQVFNNLGMFLFFAISIIGIFYMISSKGNNLSFIMAWIGITPLIIGFFSLISGHSVIESRWWYFAQILLSIPLAVAIYTIGTWKMKNLKSLYCFAFGFSVILCFLMILSPPANIDNATFSPNTNWRATLTESELQAQTILDHHEGISKSDVYYASCLNYFGYNTTAFCKEIGDRNFLSMRGDLVLVRKTILTHPFMFFSSTYKLNYNPTGLIDSAGFSRIYDDDSVSAYL